MWKKLKTNIIHKNPWYTYKHDRFAYQNGQEGDYYYISKNPSVGVIAVTDDQKIVCIKTYRYLFNEWVIETPAGGCDENILPIDGAKKELKEETGYTAKNWHELGSFHASNGLIDTVEYLFLATDLTPGEQELELGEEGTKILYFSLDEINSLMSQGKIKDSFTFAGIKLYENYLKEQHGR